MTDRTYFEASVAHLAKFKLAESPEEMDKILDEHINTALVTIYASLAGADVALIKSVGKIIARKCLVACYQLETNAIKIAEARGKTSERH